MFYRAWPWLKVLPRLALVTCFTAFGTSYIFSRAWHQLNVFLRLALVTFFPALSAGCKFCRVWYWLHVFELGVGYTFSPAWLWLHVCRVRFYFYQFCLVLQWVICVSLLCLTRWDYSGFGLGQSLKDEEAKLLLSDLHNCALGSLENAPRSIRRLMK